MSDKPHRVPCKHMFSNGMEFELFQETQCFRCVRYRNDHCKILNACYKAMFDPKYFPYKDLLDWSDGCGGKACRHYTENPIKRNRHKKQCEGQMTLGDLL